MGGGAGRAVHVVLEPLFGDDAGDLGGGFVGGADMNRKISYHSEQMIVNDVMNFSPAHLLTTDNNILIDRVKERLIERLTYSSGHI